MLDSEFVEGLLGESTPNGGKGPCLICGVAVSLLENYVE